MSPPARVVLVVKYFPPYPRISGVLTFVALLARELGRHVEVHVVTSKLPSGCDPTETVANCTVHRVAWPFPVAAAARVARLRPTATVSVSGIYDLERAAVYFGPIAAVAGLRGRSWLYQATWPRRVPGRLFRSLASHVDGVLGASEGLVGRMVDGGVRATVVEPAIDLAGLAAVSDAVRDAGDSGVFRVGFVNHLNEVKGADLALAAMGLLAERHDGMRFAVAGEGALREELLGRYSTLPGARFGGFLEERDRLELLASCDVLLLPFRQAESVLGVSQTALEAMALGSVVVGSDTRSLSGAVTSGLTGVLLDVDALGAGPLARAVERLFDDPHELRRLRDRARAAMPERWAVERRAEEVLSIVLGQ